MNEKNIEQMEISGRSLKELWIAAKWAKLFSILTIGLYFFLIILSIFSGLMTAIFAQMIPFGGFIIVLAYITLYSLTLLIPGLLIYSFATKIQKAILSANDDFTTDAFKRLRQLFQFNGVLIIAVILLTGISIVISVAATIF